MAAKQYVVKAIKKAGVHKGAYAEYQYYSMQLEGIGEPVKLSLPQPIIEDPEVGDRLYGSLTEQRGEGGRKYMELKLQKMPDSDVRQGSIEAQWALGRAIEIFLAGDYTSDDARRAAYENIEAEGNHLLNMLQRVKGN
jgi:hypothetical protein